MKKIIYFLFIFVLFFGIMPVKTFAQSAPSLIGNCGGPTGQSLVPGVGVSWGYLFGTEDNWNTIEPARGEFNWGPLDTFVNNSPSDKELWLQIVTNTASCGAASIPDWAIAAGVHQFPDKYDPGRFCKTRPVQWDPKYLEFLEEALKAMDERYYNNPKIEAYLMMSGGDWGEMALPYHTCYADARDPNNIYVKEMARVWLGSESRASEITGSCNGWEFCFDYYYFESVKKIIDMYARSFSKPVVLQLGSGLSCRATVAEKAAEYAANTYGPKVWLKQNGWGNSTSGTYFSIFSKYKNKTRIIEEAGHMENVCSKTSGDSKCVKNTQQEAIQWADYLVGGAINAGVSAVCFYDHDVLGSNTSAPQEQQKYPIQWQALYDGLAKNYNDLYLQQPTLPPCTNCGGGGGGGGGGTQSVTPGSYKIATIRFKAKSNASGDTTISFRDIPPSIVVEKGSAADILGTVMSLSFIIGEGGVSEGTPVISFKIKFRGVAEDVGAQYVIVRVKRLAFYKEFPQVVVEHKGDGIYEGNVTLLGVPPADNYNIYVKGPKHLARNMGLVNLVAGDNTTFDWTDKEKELEPGDVPPQDGKINAFDISKIIELTEIDQYTKEQLLQGDLNYDKVVNGADINELLNTLSTRRDENEY